MRNLWIELRRLFIKAPFFALGTTMVLAIGIAAMTLAMSFLWAVVLKRLPVQSPGSLVFLKQHSNLDIGSVDAYGDTSYYFSYPAYKLLEGRHDALNSLAASSIAPVDLVYNGANSAEGYAEAVSGNFFQMMGVNPVLGRILTEQDDQLNSPAVALLTKSIWEARFGATPFVLGNSLFLNGRTYQIVGVTDFPGIDDAYPPIVFVPLHFKATLAGRSTSALLQDPLSRWLILLGRQNPRIDDANSALQVTWMQFRTSVVQQAKLNETESLRFHQSQIIVATGQYGITGLADRLHGFVASLIFLGLVLLGACIGTAGNLYVIRAVRRAGEMAIRLSLGANRRVLAFDEILTITITSVTGCLSGIGLAILSIHLLRDSLSTGEPVKWALSSISGLRITIIATMTGAVVGLVLSIIPVQLIWRGGQAKSIYHQNTRVASGIPRVQQILVAVQVAMTVTLLTLSGVIATKLHGLYEVDLGFQPREILGFSLVPSRGTANSIQTRSAFESLRLRLMGAPGVSGVAFSAIRLLSGDLLGGTTTVPGYRYKSGERDTIEDWVSNDYFNVMRIPIIAGRAFEETDNGTPEYRVIVDESFARRFFRTPELALNARIYLGSSETPEYQARIVGVAHTSRIVSVGAVPTWPTIYLPYNRIWNMRRSYPLTVYLRTSAPTGELASLIKTAVEQNCPQFAVINLESMNERIRTALTSQRMLAVLSTVLGSVSFVLIGLSLYGVFNLFVRSRLRELSIRVALGASLNSMWLNILMQVAWAVSLGVIAALGSVWALVRYLELLTGPMEGDIIMWFSVAAASVLVISLGSAIVAGGKVIRGSIMLNMSTP